MNVLIFGGLYFGFVIVRFVILKATMPAPPPMPSAPTESAGGTLIGFIADIFLGTSGIGTAFGQGWDEASNEAKVHQYRSSIQQWSDSYQNDVVAPRVGALLIGILIALVITIGCTYYAGM